MHHHLPWRRPRRPLNLTTGLLLAAAPLCAQAAPANLLVNAGFEQASSYGQFKGAGDTSITGWTTALSGVEYFDATGYGGAATGAGPWVVDLANYTYLLGGAIEQTVATVAGQAYGLDFFAGNYLGFGRDGTGEVKVTVDGQTSVFQTAAATGAQTAWASRHLDFVAQGSSTTLRFWNDQNPNLHFAFIDGVSLVEAVPASVPEPGTGLLLGLGIVALAWRPRRR